MVTLEQAHRAVFAWMAARAEGRPARLPWPELAWLGLDFEPGELEPAPVGPLVGPEGLTLEDLRRRGYLPAAVLAWLAEVGWRNPGDHALQSRPEMLLAYRPEELGPGPVAFDGERLDEVQAIFALELTPGELLEGTLPLWRDLLGGEPTPGQRQDLEGLALLYGAEVHLLPDFPRLAGFYAKAPEAPGLPALAERFRALEPWDAETLQPALDALSHRDREAMSTCVTGVPESPGLAEVLALLGRERVVSRLAR